MSAISIHRAEFLGFPNDLSRNQQRFHGITPFVIMAMDSRPLKTYKKEELYVHLPETPDRNFQNSRLPHLRFDRLQEGEFEHEDKFEFGQFVAREAVIDEELWTAAWLRAESHWENKIHDRFVDNQKRQFVDQEFYAIKRRRTCQLEPKYTCIVTVKKEDKNVKRTVLKSVVGTLDLSIRPLMEGETYPGERVKTPLFHKRGSQAYGYIANLCVAKSARRQGIASNMMHFAVELAKSVGMEHVYVHVRRDNTPAQKLYSKIGFEIVEDASSKLVEEKMYLLRFKV